MIRFCTAVVVEVLGSVASVESHVVKRIYSLIRSVLEIGTDGHSENKVSLKNTVENKINMLCRTVAQQDTRKHTHTSIWMMGTFLRNIDLFSFIRMLFWPCG